VSIDGWTAPGFENVRSVFEKNFANGLEVGAAFAAYHQGEHVVDLWGGVADRRDERPWAQNTLEVVFSTTKGATAICANRLAGGATSMSRRRSSSTGPSSARRARSESRSATCSRTRRGSPGSTSPSRSTPRWPENR
jgi:hypothetical protein